MSFELGERKACRTSVGSPSPSKKLAATLKTWFLFAALCVLDLCNKIYECCRTYCTLYVLVIIFTHEPCMKWCAKGVLLLQLHYHCASWREDAVDKKTTPTTPDAVNKKTAPTKCQPKETNAGRWVDNKNSTYPQLGGWTACCRGQVWSGEGVVTLPQTPN